MEPPPFQLETIMAESQKYSQQFPVKGGVALLCGREFGGEEGQRTPIS